MERSQHINPTKSAIKRFFNDWTVGVIGSSGPPGGFSHSNATNIDFNETIVIPITRAVTRLVDQVRVLAIIQMFLDDSINSFEVCSLIKSAIGDQERSILRKNDWVVGKERVGEFRELTPRAKSLRMEFNINQKIKVVPAFTPTTQACSIRRISIDRS